MQTYFEYSKEVEEAINEKKPVLALESTLITHGLPYPYNIEVAREAENIARKQGVTPATIALMKGKIKIGLSSTELDELVADKKAVKASQRDIPSILSREINAGTTVAATLFCAHQANIKVFATGGIGGVHRGDAQDISADLTELARTPLAVVASGAKSILDLPKTLELLETFSVPIIGYRTQTFPAFYTSSTTFPLPMQVDDIDKIVSFLKIHWQLGLSSSVLIANPVPKQDEIPTEIIEPIVMTALQMASAQNINGKNMTPFLLNEVVKATEGKSLQTNISLIKNNVKVGAEIAFALYKMRSLTC